MGVPFVVGGQVAAGGGPGIEPVQVAIKVAVGEHDEDPLRAGEYPTKPVAPIREPGYCVSCTRFMSVSTSLVRSGSMSSAPG